MDASGSRFAMVRAASATRRAPAESVDIRPKPPGALGNTSTAPAPVPVAELEAAGDDNVARHARHGGRGRFTRAWAAAYKTGSGCHPRRDSHAQWQPLQASQEDAAAPRQR